VKLHIQPMSDRDVRKSVAWTYDPPYDIYNHPTNRVFQRRDGANRYFSVHDEAGRLIGTCCFGAEARVAGGDYAREEPDMLDVGVSMHPGLVGRGRGGDFVAAILEFGSAEYGPSRFRATIAAFNERSLRTFAKLGFAETFRFEREGDGLAFIQVESDAV